MSALPQDSEEVYRIIGSATGDRSRCPITPSTDLRRDLGLDSIGLMSIVYLLEDKTGFEAFDFIDDFIAAETVEDILVILRESRVGT
jgi:acyl carrier protein